ncbi:nicotinic acid mononucleotide adenyltransferase [Ascidiimonas sp. W6]|uniref:nicotinic acid mononucleotide adenyltransferase n=1 Tax=Ascidiimonas meishanensis TaxID=3128903 RepID=UPI0030ED8C48
MKALRLLFGTLVLGMFLVSCEADIIIADDFIDEPGLSLNQLLTSHDVWYVDINRTTGSGEVPFLQKAFTVSFDFGVLTANNNLVGFGNTGNGFGIDVGNYDAYGSTLDIDHDADGFWRLEVIQLNSREIRLYHRASNTSYYLEGYQINNFDYDRLFYENIQYFLQEYQAWEKTYTSDFGALNEFDEETFLQFFSNTNAEIFRSSIDENGTRIANIVWDYEGLYEVFNVQGDNTVKTLTLDYDFLGNDYFELTVIDDRTIELFHPDSGTIYEFRGRGYTQFLKGEQPKKRKKQALRTMNVERKSERKSVKIK